jgi:hypothetical protein
MKPYSFNHPVYPQTFIMFNNWTNSQVNQWLYVNKYSMGVEIENCSALVFVIDGVIFLWFETTEFKIASLGRLVHEVGHAVNYMFKKMGIKPDLDNDETSCYESQWLFCQIAKKFK